jgi:hypothetical protein
VASTAQFTPKTVETASERQKLMFRVKARIDRELLQKHLQAGQDRPARHGLGASSTPSALAELLAGQPRCHDAMAESPARRPPAGVACATATRRRWPASRWTSRRRMVGLIGPDGVGKSSLLALIAGARAIQQGSVRCWAATWPAPPPRRRLPAHRLHAAGPGQEPLPHAVGRENLHFFGRLFGHDARRAAPAHRRPARSTGLHPFLTARRASSPAA